MSNGGGTRPATSITIIDPKILEAIGKVKEDTEAIKAKLVETGQASEKPRYFPKGYFG